MSVAQSILAKVAQNAGKLRDFPHITENGRWQTTSDGCWTGGFWAGLLWLCYQLSHDEKYLDCAYQWLSRLEARKQDRTFDLGFLFYPSYVLGDHINKDERLREVALDAADTQSRLFHRKAGFIYNRVDFEGRKIGRTAIDAMMNLPLLWWAYKMTEDERYYQPAYQHCLSTAEKLIRQDYSTIHVLDFDLGTGETIRKITVQGYGDDSCWSRGQAWAIYGFTLAYQSSREEKFLRAAKNLAEYFIDNLPDDYVPYWDFNDPEIPEAVKDSSAAAIACSGLFTLAEMSQDGKFEEAATEMIDSLSANYLADDEFEGILRRGCYHKPANIGVDEGTIWGDYYFVEALAKSGLYSNNE